MKCDERIKIISELKCVDYVVKSIDVDRTVCKTLETVKPKPFYFCNGGDQNNNTIPETDICQKRGIILRDGFGDKIQSSSWLIKGSQNKIYCILFLNFWYIMCCSFVTCLNS